MQCEPLATILENDLPALGAPDIDLLTVDVQGMDLEVLRSSDRTRYPPTAVVVEVLASDLTGLLQSDVATFLGSIGYQPFSKLVNSAVFVSAAWLANNLIQARTERETTSAGTRE